MNRDGFPSLFERIRSYCHQKQWYGPDIHEDDGTYIFNWDPGGRWIGHDFRSSFFPPATEEQLRFSEDAMGFPYPSLLRTLYLQVANGGFGPAYGLVGTSTSYGYAHAMYKKEQTFIDVEQYEKQSGDRKKIYLDPLVWPNHLIDLCEWGCGYFSFLHAYTGHVYHFGEDYLYHQASSLEEWLERWLRGEDLEQVIWA